MQIYICVLSSEFYKGKRVILTGTSKGIGKRLAVQLAKLGTRYIKLCSRTWFGVQLCHIYRLVIAARSADKLQETAQECLQYTEDVHAVVADVSQEADCRAIVDTAVQKLGGVDILILNAAVSPTPSWFWKYEKPVSAHHLAYIKTTYIHVYMYHILN